MSAVAQNPEAHAEATAERSAPQAKLRYFPFLEGMRALAALVVVFNHIYAEVFPPEQGRTPSGLLGLSSYFMVLGHLAVTVFIVISGFCLAIPVVNNGGAMVGGFQRFIKRRARRILPRSEFSEPGKPLAKERWAGAVDVVGGQVLANVCASVKYRGVVAACGLAGGLAFPATVAPFILRGVTLAGIDSVMCPLEERREAWRRLGQHLDPALLGEMTQRIALEDAITVSERLIAGAVRGRVIVPIDL